MITIQISRKRLKKLAKRPQIRPRIIKSLGQFDDNINSEQDAELNVQTETANTVGLLRCLVEKANSVNQFKLSKRQLLEKFWFGQKSLNFNLAALHQLHMVTVNWRAYKSTHYVEGTVNRSNVF